MLKLKGELTRAQLYYVDFMMDVLTYTVVLNLFAEYVDEIILTSFTVSLLTAVVMKGLLDLIQLLIDRLERYFSEKEGTAARVGFWLSAWAILFFSKIAILQIVDIIFEDDVDLGGFLYVLVLVIVMMVARRISTAVFLRFGRARADSSEPVSKPGTE